jgi:hypothetical protein
MQLVKHSQSLWGSKKRRVEISFIWSYNGEKGSNISRKKSTHLRSSNNSSTHLISPKTNNFNRLLQMRSSVCSNQNTHYKSFLHSKKTRIVSNATYNTWLPEEQTTMGGWYNLQGDVSTLWRNNKIAETTVRKEYCWMRNNFKTQMLT